MVGGVVPVPNAALLLRSSTAVLLPSQCSCMPSRGFCSQIGRKVRGCTEFLLGQAGRIGKLKITLAELKVSTRPGPQCASSITNEKRPASISSRSRISATATG